MTDRSVIHTRAHKEAADQPSRREQILRAAVVVFSTRGYRETLVDHIAEEAGVAKGTLYLYFGSKEEMYLEAFRETFEKLHEATVARMEEASSIWEKIKAFVAVRLEFGETHKDFLRIYLSEFVGTMVGRGGWTEQLRALLRRESEFLGKILEQGIQSGEVRAVPPAQLVSMLQYMLAGVMTSRVAEIRLSEGRLDPDMIVDLLRKGLGPPGS